MRVLPPLPATAQGTQPAAAIPPVGRVIAAQVITPVAGELYQVRAGEVTLQVQSAVPLLKGQQIQLQLQARPDGSTGWVVLANSHRGSPATPPDPRTATMPPPLATTATVLPGRQHGIVTASLGNGLYQIEAQGRPLQAFSQEPLFKGQQLELRPATGPSSNVQWLASTDASSPIRRQLMTNLPRQQDATLLMALLQKLAPSLPAQGGTPVQQAMSAVLAALPNAAAIGSPEALRQALQKSGLLQDAMPGQPPNLRQSLQQLLTVAPPPAQDAPPAPRPGTSAPPGQIQAQPRQPIEALAMLDSEALEQLTVSEARAVLARLETHQLMHLQQQDGPVRQWLFELPVRSGDGVDLWQLHVQKDGRPAREQQETADNTNFWQVTLSVSFPETGAVVIRLTLHGDQLNAHFHAAAGETHERIREYLPALAAILDSKGLKSQLSSQPGLPHPDILPEALHTVLKGVSA